MHKIWNTLHTVAVVGTVVVLVTFVVSPFAGCEAETSDFNPPLASANKIAHTPPPFDTLKFHAFDKMFFGDKSTSYKKYHIIDKMKYSVSCTKELPDGRVYSLLLVGDTKIDNTENAETVLEGIKNIITVKYPNYDILHQYYFIKDPKERERNQACFSLRDKLRYNEYHIGTCYEYAGYKWDLENKHIQVGYFINQGSKDAGPLMNDPRTYTMYIEITSKILEQLVPENENPDLRRKMEASKF
ncbi:hypothetical protein OGH69_12760 [Flavobacterium sp. MFBS3-15]|uniref:hypothetical protein n=1 Tax=Flavobacterium sp. MFBS3-15 TaxID=2989816 RepID=UPI0022358C3F|nr:hypothetical protein [Flavobacterium sp. MFBS3-15]MCW4469843.1 hypothetical protein [Flavobacterium sp. MFBS3-15]